ncbi:hypothetical protein CRG98_042959 [Punica granatum]|uniref:Uncharacterized protein n=1 Tax=Punica granatum TaxID=22663 RepID=A0A2I0HY69_PUNGR|nr:hypothetical protein CRG98_042959 [Punica granatum]
MIIRDRNMIKDRKMIRKKNVIKKRKAIKKMTPQRTATTSWDQMTIIQRSLMMEELIQVEAKEYKEVKEKCREKRRYKSKGRFKDKTTAEREHMFAGTFRFAQEMEGSTTNGIYRGPATFSSTAGAAAATSTSDANLEEEQVCEGYETDEMKSIHDEDSDNEVTRYPCFNPEDESSVVITKSMEFESLEQFKNVVRDLNISIGGMWVVRASDVLGPYYAQKTRKMTNKLATREWIAPKLVPLVRIQPDVTGQVAYDYMIHRLNKDAAKWLNDIPADRWSRSAFDTVCKNQAVTSNMCEKFNGAILKYKGKPIITMFEGTNDKIYSNYINPAAGERFWETTGFDPIQTPIVKRKPGKPKTKRKKSPEEDSNPHKMKRKLGPPRCSRCKQSYKGKRRRDGFDVTKDQTDVTEDRIDVTRDEFDVPKDELDVTRDEFDVPNDEFDVTRDEFDVTMDELDETRDELKVTMDEFDLTRDEFDVTRDEFDVPFFSGTQMMQFA